MVKVLLVDDDETICRALELQLRDVDVINTIGSCHKPKDAIEAVLDKKPDVILMDFTMREMNGDELARRILDVDNAAQILALTQHDDKEVIKSMVRSGARGYIVKGVGKYELIESILEVSQGKPYFQREIANALIEDQLNNSEAVKEAERITSREREILKHISEGMTNKEIGALLEISERTVDAHRRNMLEKLAVNNSSELIRKGIRLGLI